MKKALVTGGNRGIGLAIVKGLAEIDDIHVLLGCRDVEMGQKIAEGIGESVSAVAVDLAEAEKLNEQAKAISEEHGPLSILVNNAGILREGRGMSISEDDVQESLQVNAMGAYQLIRAFAPGMIEQDYGRIVNMSSGWGSLSDGLTGPFAYSVSKALLNAITLAISNDLPDAVKVNAMCPGWVRTDMGGPSASRSPEEGAETAIWLATLDESAGTGGFFRDKQRISW